MSSNKQKYLIATLVLFIIEIAIAKYILDTIIRPYIGDVLVVVLIYCFVKTFFDIEYIKAAVGVLLFAFAVEFLQYLNIVGMLGLSKNRFASIIVGNSFSWIDIGCYCIGILIVIGIEKMR